jgi:hypothetical protein
MVIDIFPPRLSGPGSYIFDGIRETLVPRLSQQRLVREPALAADARCTRGRLQEPMAQGETMTTSDSSTRRLSDDVLAASGYAGPSRECSNWPTIRQALSEG